MFITVYVICYMYNRSQYQTTSLKFNKTRSPANFTHHSQRSIPTQPIPKYNSTNDTCMACQHQNNHHSKLKTFHSTARTKMRQINSEQYYAVEDGQMNNLKKAKRFLEEMLQKNRNELHRNTQHYQTKIAAVSQQLKNKTQQLSQLQILLNHLKAQQQYQANVSLVRSYKQINTNNDDDQQSKNKKLKQLSRKNALLQQQLTQKQQQIQNTQSNMKKLQQKMQKMNHYEYYKHEYEAMKALISKMQMDKLQLLDKHQQELQSLQHKYQQDIEHYQSRIADLKVINDNKSHQVDLLDRQLKQIKHQLNSFKGKQFNTLKQLLQQKEKECQALQSKITCIQSEVNYLKERYGYILKLAKNDNLNQQNQNQEYIIQRVGRFNISAGKESLLGMNLSPIRRR